MHTSPLRRLTAALLMSGALLTLSGCTMMLATGDIDEESAEKTTARDQTERMNRLRDNGTLNAHEHEQLSQKMGQSQGNVPYRPSIEELEKRVEADRKAAGN